MQQITLTSKLENRGHYVPGMISGDKLYISGQLPVHHETGSPMADSIEQQTRDGGRRPLPRLHPGCRGMGHGQRRLRGIFRKS